jgi:hypothetical protein
MAWKVEREARMEPPIQTEYLRSGGATILIFMDEGARAVISRCMLIEKEKDQFEKKRKQEKKDAYRSAIPGYMVVPPDKTMFP